MKRIILIAAFAMSLIGFGLGSSVLADSMFAQQGKNFDDTAKMARQFAQAAEAQGNFTVAAKLRHIAEDYSELASSYRLIEQTGDFDPICANLSVLREIAQFQDELADANADDPTVEQFRQSSNAMRETINMCEMGE